MYDLTCLTEQRQTETKAQCVVKKISHLLKTDSTSKTGVLPKTNASSFSFTNHVIAAHTQTANELLLIAINTVVVALLSCVG